MSLPRPEAVRLVLGALLTLVATGPAPAQVARPAPVTTVSDAVALLATLKDASARIDALFRVRDYAGVHAFVAARAGADPRLALSLHVADAVAWELQGQPAQGDAAFTIAETGIPEGTNARVVTIELATALRYGGPAVEERVLARAIERQPEAIAGVNARLAAQGLGPALASGDKARLDALIDPLVALGLGRDDPSGRVELVMLAVDARLRRGHLADAAALLEEVNDHDKLVALLTDRRYAALWPAVEKRVGPHMATSDAAAIAIAKERQAAAPEDGRLRRALIHANYAAGRLADADKAGADLAVTPAGLQALDQERMWAVNDHALVLDAEGRTDAADARFAAMESVDLASHPWVASGGIFINRVEMLASHGRWAAAQQAFPRMADVAALAGSAYAAQLVRKLAICIARGLHPAADVTAKLAELGAHRADNPGAVVDGLVCAGQEDEAAGVLVAMLADEKTRTVAIAAVQPPDHPIADPSSAQRRAQALARRPDVLAALNRVGRLLPVGLRATAVSN